MMKSSSINFSSTYRPPADYFVNGMITSGVIAGGINYNKFKQKELEKGDAIKNTIKVGTQGGIASASAVASMNYLGSKNYLGAALSMALGLGSIVAIEKITYKDKENATN